MGTYLRSFSERVADVPGYLRRHLALIRDLDEKVVALQQEIELHSKRKLADKQSRSPEGKRQRIDGQAPPYDIESAVTRLLSLADEKVTIAAQVYDFIDKHIQHLDEDLRSLISEIQADKSRIGLPDEQAACAQLGIELKRGVRKGSKAAPALAVEADAAAAAAAGKDKKRHKGKKKEDELGSEALLGAQAPASLEPLYCFCQRPSHGNMVACENDECQFEWFHFECVGLTEAPAPDQTWYCPQCAKLRESAGAC